MKKKFNYLKIFIVYGFAACVFLFTVSSIIVYFYQDEIIKLFVSELNKNLKTKVEVGKIELSLFDKFPHVSLSFEQIQIAGAIPEQKQPLVKADLLLLTFDFWNIFAGKYKVNEVFLENANVQVYLNKNGDENYQIFKKSDSSSGNQEVNFDLQKIQLDKVDVTYIDQKNNNIYKLFTNKAAASLQVKGANLLVLLQGHLNSKFIQMGNYKYFADKDIELESEIIYNLDKSNLLIKPSTLVIKHSAFQVEGTFENHSQGLIDLRVKGKDTDIQTLVSLLPPQYSNELSVYKSKGKIYFDSQIKGATLKGAIPAIAVQFGCEDASFYQQDINQRIENAHLKGSFTNGKRYNRSTSELHLTHIKGVLEGKPFSGNFSLKNFDNPYLIFDVKGELDVASLLSIYPVDPVLSGSGTLVVNVDFEGKLADLRSKAVNQFVQTKGNIQINGLTFRIKNIPLHFREINGDFVFNKSDLLVNNLQGKASNSDFKLSGLFKNIMSYVFFKDQNLKVEAEFNAHLLDFDELLAIETTPSEKLVQQRTNQASENYQFAISPHLTFDLNCTVDHLKFRRFKASQIRSNLQVNNQIATSENISFHTANGQIQVNATLNAQHTNDIKVNCNADLNGLAIDSVFYMFENFDQDFILDKHLQGKVNAHVQTSMVFNEHLAMSVPSLTANAQTKIIDGGLIDFEPMQKLSRFINQRELANIRFSEMENNIHIADQTVYIPEMEIRSNVSNISIKGTHTFDQLMDYRLKIPTYNLTKKRALMVADQEKTSNLFLSIKGTSDNYKIAYDQQAVKEKIKEDLKEEKKELKSLFKSKHTQPDQTETVKKKNQEEQKEEFFDW